MTSRQASISDARAMSAVILPAAEPLHGVDFTDAGWALLQATNTREAFEARFESDNYYAVVYELDNLVVGYIALLDLEKIDHMFVLPEFQGRGIARQLWQAAKNGCEQAGRGDFYWVRSSTVAEPVYQSFGFHAVGQRQSSQGISAQRMEMGAPLSRL